MSRYARRLLGSGVRIGGQLRQDLPSAVQRRRLVHGGAVLGCWFLPNPLSLTNPLLAATWPVSLILNTHTQQWLHYDVGYVLQLGLGAADDPKNQSQVGAALHDLDTIQTFYGPVNFDTAGSNIAKPMVITQVICHFSPSPPNLSVATIVCLHSRMAPYHRLCRRLRVPWARSRWWRPSPTMRSD